MQPLLDKAIRKVNYKWQRNKEEKPNIWASKEKEKVEEQ